MHVLRSLCLLLAALALSAATPVIEQLQPLLPVETGDPEGLLVDWSGTASAWQLEYSFDRRHWTTAGPVTADPQALTGLPRGRLVFVRLRDGAQTSNVQQALTLAAVATSAAPRGLVARLLPDDRVRLRWHDDLLDETGFQIQVAVDGAAFTTIAEPAAAKVSSVTGAIDASQTHVYRIRALGPAGASPWSEAVPLLITGDYQVALLAGQRYLQAHHRQVDTSLPVPSGLSGTTLDSSSLRLHWQPLSGSHNQIMIACSWDGERFMEVDRVPGDSSSYLHEQLLLPGRSRSYRLFSLSGSTFSAGSTTVTLTPPAYDPQLAAPADLEVAIDGDDKQLSWTASAEASDGYRIEYAAISDARFSLLTTVAAGTTSYRHAVSYDGYRYRVLSQRDGAWSRPAGPVQVAPAAARLSPGIDSIEALAATTVQLTWSLPTTSAHNGVLIQRAQVGSEVFRAVGWVDDQATSFLDRRARAETAYRYRLLITDYIKPWDSGPEQQIQTPAHSTAPVAPDQLTGSGVADNQIALRWRDRADNETAYLVQRASPSGSFSTIATLPADCASHHDVVPGTGTWRYRIQASNDHGGRNSSIISVDTASGQATASVELISNSDTRRLLVTGSEASDTLVLRQTGDTVTVDNHGTTIGSATDLDEIEIRCGSGADNVSLAASLQVRCLIYGGDGADNVRHLGPGRAIIVLVGGGADVGGGGDGTSLWMDTADQLDSSVGSPGTVRRIDRFHQPWSQDPSHADHVGLEPRGETWDDPGFWADQSHSRYPEAPLFPPHGPVALDVNQGESQICGDSSFYASLADMAPRQLEDALCDLGDGTYAMAFAPGQERFARFDGSLNPDRWSEPGANGSLWWPLLEKGIFAFELPYPSDRSRQQRALDLQQDGQELFALVTAALADGHLVKVRSTGDTVLNAPFVRQGHAYSVLEAFRRADGSPRFILRNPYGRSATSYNHEWVMPLRREGFIEVGLDELQSNCAYGTISRPSLDEDPDEPPVMIRLIGIEVSPGSETVLLDDEQEQPTPACFQTTRPDDHWLRFRPDGSG